MTEPLPTITENRNESTYTLVDTKMASRSNTTSDSNPSAGPTKMRLPGSLPTAIPGNIARWLPNISGRDGPSAPESAASTPIFPMSPEVEVENPFQMASSPDYLPATEPQTRRDSFAESSLSLARVRSEDGSVAPSALSEATGSHFRELDERLRLFMLDNEPQPKDVPVEQISTEPLTNQEKLALPFSFECAFGWSGAPEELEQTPKNKEAFLGKLYEAKNGCTFIRRTLHEYQTEINSRKIHKFTFDFLKKQNDAILFTTQQIDDIEEHIDEVVNEVYAIDEDDGDQLLKKELTTAYEHVYPWVMRTKRVVFDNHVWYKLNYVMGAHTKPVKPLPKAAPGGNGVLPTKINGLRAAPANRA